MLTTERLLLREWREEDAPALFRYASDPRVGPIAGWRPHPDEAYSREVIRTVFAVPETYAVCRLTDGLPIGCVGLKTGNATDMTDRPDEGEIGYWLGVPYWGNEYIPEAVRRLIAHAFTDLGMTRLWCGYYDGNLRSRRVMDKCGFVYHHKTEGLYVSGVDEYRTGHVTTLSRADWERQAV